MGTRPGGTPGRPWVVFALLLLVSPLYVVNLTGWFAEDDEGAYVYTAWRMAEGDSLYTEVLSTKPPVSLLAAAGAFRVFGPGIAVARTLGLLVMALAAVLIFFAGRRLGGPACGALALLLLALHPDVVRSARFFRPDIFLLAAASGTWLALLAAIDGGRRALFAVAGALAVTTVASKLSGALVLVAVVLAVLWFRREEPAPRSRLAFAFGAGGALAFGGLLLFLFAPDFLTQTVGHQMKQTGGYTFFGRAEHGFRYTLTRILHNYPVTVPAIVLAALAFRARPSRFPERALAATFPTMLLMLFVGRELYARHFLVYLPALCLLSARALTFPVGPRARRLQALGLVVFLAWFAWEARDLFPRIGASERETLELARVVRDRTEPGDVVFGDYAEINFHARRKGTPLTPRLSRGAIESGEITTDRILDDLRESNARLVFLRTGTDDSRLDRDGINPSPHLLNLPDFERLVDSIERDYRLLGVYMRGPQVFRLYIRE